MFTTPPSIRIWSSIITGWNNEGNAPLAVIALAKLPLFKTTSAPVSILVAIQKNGIGNCSKSSISLTWRVNFESKLNTFWPLESAEGNLTLKFSKGSVTAYFSELSRS